MKPLLLIAGFYAVINAAVIVGIGLVRGSPAARPIAIHRDGAPARTNEEMGLELLLETVQLATSDRPQLIVLGASGAAGAYSPLALQARLPGFTASNLAMPGATILELRRVFDEVLWETPPSVLRESVLVLGISYTMFCSDAVRFSNNKASPQPWWTGEKVVTDVDKAADRSPPILDISHPLRHVFPRWLVLAAKQRLRIWDMLIELPSFHPADWLTQRGRWRVQTDAMRRARERRQAEFPRPQPILQWFLALPVERQVKWFMDETLRSGQLLDESQFDNMSLLLGRALSAGMTVVVVDIPLQSEHRRHAPWLPTFQARLGRVVAAHIDRRRPHLIDLTASLPDEAFSDLAHANAARTDDWVDLLVDRLRPLLQDQSPRSRE